MCNDVQWLVMPSSFLQKLPWVLRRFWWMRPLCERSRLLWLRLLWRCENCNKGDDVFSIAFGLVICNRGHARTFFESVSHGRAQMLNLFLRRPCRCYPHRGSSCCWVSFLHLVRKWQCQLLRHFFMRSCHTCPILSRTFRCHQSITRMREPTYMTWLVFERVGWWHGYGILYRICCDMLWRYSRSVAIGWFGVIFDDLWLTKRTTAGLQILQPHFSPTSACALCPGKRYNEACGGCVSWTLGSGPRGTEMNRDESFGNMARSPYFALCATRCFRSWSSMIATYCNILQQLYKYRKYHQISITLCLPHCLLCLHFDM